MTVISGDATAPLAVPLRFTFTTASSGSLEGIRSFALFEAGRRGAELYHHRAGLAGSEGAAVAEVGGDDQSELVRLRPASVTVPSTSAVTPSFRTVTVLPALLVPIATLP